MAVKQSSRRKSYLEFMSKYVPNLWRMRFDLFLLFALISLGLHLAGRSYQYDMSHINIAGDKSYPEGHYQTVYEANGYQAIDVSIVSLYWIIPVLLMFALGYWICRSVRVREIVGTRNKPLCTSLALMFSIIFAPKIFYMAYIGNTSDLSDLSIAYFYIAVSLILSCSVFIKSVTLSKLSTTIYGFIIAIIFAAFLIFSFFMGFLILKSFDPTFYLSDMEGEIAFIIFGVVLLLPSVILAMRAGAKTQGRFSSLGSVTVLWCLIFAFVTFIIGTTFFTPDIPGVKIDDYTPYFPDIHRYIYQGLLAAALPPCVDLLSGFIAKRLALPKKA